MTALPAPGADPGPGAGGQDVTRPTGVTDRLSQRSLGFAAAPVTTSPEGQSSSIWDLTATDVFPIASPEPLSHPAKDAPGASAS